MLDYQTYSDGRDAARRVAMAAKQPRRIHLGEHLTFLFENHDTILYQVQEIMLAERIVREAAVSEELDTYNGMLGGPGQLGCALLIEIDDKVERRRVLESWMGLQERIYAVAADGGRAYAEFDPSQVGGDRLSAVQYLLFTLSSPPVALGCDFHALTLEADLDEVQQGALAADLAATLR